MSEGNIAPIKDSNGRTTGAVLLMQDMTKIKASGRSDQDG